jgi:hypothetical protein
MKQVLSLGAGVQSSTVLMMSITGELPRLDGVIFANTGWEPAAVYENLEWLRQQSEKAGIPFYVVNRDTTIRDDALNSMIGGVKSKGSHHASMPLHTLSTVGKKGMIRRQCTSEFKIRLIERQSKLCAGLKPRARLPKHPVVTQWVGISADEAMRARRSRDAWLTLYYPLIELNMRRLDCLEWMQDHGFPKPPRSACIGCPFHDNGEWRHMQRYAPEEFADAVDFDRKIRHADKMKSRVYLHQSCKPLDQIDFTNAEDHGQLNMFNNECAGVCGV